MSNYGSYGPRRRTDMRKKKRMNTIVNTAIALVFIGIVFVSGMLIFGGDSSETATTNNENENNELNESNENMNEDNDFTEIDENNVVDDEENVDLGENNVSDVNDDETNDMNDDEENNVEENNVEENNEEVSDNDYRTTPVTDGDWEPIGTVQEEPFVASYEKNHVNWEEMSRAMQYATGLGEDMTIWWIGNGGDHQTAEGYVSDLENKDTPYKVRLEWVTNEGWKPVSVEQVEENPYN